MRYIDHTNCKTAFEKGVDSDIRSLGKLTRTAKVRVIRDGIVVYTGILGSLKRFKDDVKDVREGYECGLVFDGFDQMAEGDLVEAYEMVEVPRQ